MSMFQRYQTVSVQKTPQGYVARGDLCDHLYGMAVKLAMNSDLVVTDVQGEMIRYTTDRCPLGLESLPKAKGFNLAEAGVESRIKKEIGRPGCRHLATLLVTMSRCLRRNKKFEAGSVDGC